MTPQEKVDQITADLNRAGAAAAKANAERQAAAVGAYGDETILGDSAFKKATRAAIDAEQEVEGLTLALAGANAELEKWQGDEETRRKRETVARLTALCREREAVAGDIEKAMRALATSLGESERLVGEIKKLRPNLPGLMALIDPLDSMEFRLNLKAGFMGLDKLGLGEPVNEFGVHKDEPLADMEARVHRQIIDAVTTALNVTS